MHLLRKKPQVPNWEAELKAGRPDMQGLLVRGYKSLNAACYIFFRITDTPAATAYLNTLLPHITTAAKPPAHNAPSGGDPEEAVQLAFTSRGLRALGLPDEVLDTFSREFIEGMSFCYPDPHDTSKSIRERSTLLGDTKNNEPKYWHWGNENNPVDGVLMFFARTGTALSGLMHNAFYATHQGLAVAFPATCYEYDGKVLKEHFGFDDGISQPLLKGLSRAQGQADRKLINPGEIILGYRNEYHSYSPSPYVAACPNARELPALPNSSDKKDLGKNGTYLVFRQMEQHVEKFCDFIYRHSKETGITRMEKAVKLAAKMIGRWPNGLPLTTFPQGGCPATGAALEDFGYAAQDASGMHCPLGAHIRRIHPRDQVHTGRQVADSIDLSRKHRMLRRGRIYGEPFAPEFDLEKMISKVADTTPEPDKPDQATCAAKDESYSPVPLVRGLHFICLVSDIARQFEFVQNVWANTSTFGDLCNEVDPIISPRPTTDQPDCHEFTTPQSTVRNRYLEVPEFTTVVGGAYFFMPGLQALRFLLHASAING